MRYLFFMTFALLCLSGCTRSTRDTTLFQSNGRQKPIVAVLPVLDRSGTNGLTWELSRELTDEIRKRIYDSPKIYLLREGGSAELAEILNENTPDSIGPSVLDNLNAAEFVVVSELIEQKQVPYGAGSRVSADEENTKPFRTETGSLLTLAMRLRVFDLRHEKPKIILQEVINKDHVVCRPYSNSDYARSPWGTEAFNHTPMGFAHMQLVREVVSRVETYVESVR